MAARTLTAISAAAGVLLVAWASAMAEPTRVRAPFSADVSTAADVIRILAPAERPSGAGELSAYVAAGFAPGSTELLEAAKQHLALVAEAMSAPGLERALIVVEGHTDASGDAAYNDSLSLARARSAGEHLIALGVPRSRLALRAMGERPTCFPASTRWRPSSGESSSSGDSTLPMRRDRSSWRAQRARCSPSWRRMA